jgi:hypothetical protein
MAGATHATGITIKPSKKSEASSALSKCGNWSVFPSPNLGNIDELNGVAALSISNVWSVGGFNSNSVEQTRIEHWDGTSWSIVSRPNVGSADNFLNGVAQVPRTNQLWAVGRYYDNSGLLQTLVEHWDGKNRSIVSSPNVPSVNNLFFGIAAVSVSDAWAVGYTFTSSSSQTLIEHWDGTSWNIVTAPNNGAQYAYLYGITAVSANNVWTVGSYYDKNNIQQTLTEHWNGKKWSITTSPNAAGATGSMLRGVARIPGSNKIWAIGTYTTSHATALTLIEYWNGTSWNSVSSPNPGSANNFVFNTLSGVAAASANNAWAVGSYYNSGGYQTLVEHWDGTSWSVFSSPTPGSGQNTLTSATRIPGTNKVWAVGFYSNVSGYPQSLTEFNC